MADEQQSVSSDNSVLEHTSTELFSIKHDSNELEYLSLKGERLTWTGDPSLRTQTYYVCVRRLTRPEIVEEICVRPVVPNYGTVVVAGWSNKNI